MLISAKLSLDQLQAPIKSLHTNRRGEKQRLKNTSIEPNQAIRPCYGLAALNKGDRLVSWAFELRELRSNDIAVKIQFFCLILCNFV